MPAKLLYGLYRGGLLNSVGAKEADFGARAENEDFLRKGEGFDFAPNPPFFYNLR